LNTNGFFDHLLSFLDHMTATGFLKTEHRAMLLVGQTPEELFGQMTVFVPPHVSKVNPSR
jgi:predicted Rossmann-fold nucleotide-binding protein